MFPLFHPCHSRPTSFPPHSAHAVTCDPASLTTSSPSSRVDWSESARAQFLFFYFLFAHAQFLQHCADIRNEAHPADILAPSGGGAGHTFCKQGVLCPHLLSNASSRTPSVARMSGLISPLGKLLTALYDLISFGLTVVMEGA